MAITWISVVYNRTFTVKRPKRGHKAIALDALTQARLVSPCVQLDTGYNNGNRVRSASSTESVPWSAARSSLSAGPGLARAQSCTR